MIKRIKGLVANYSDLKRFKALPPKDRELVVYAEGPGDWPHRERTMPTRYWLTLGLLVLVHNPAAGQPRQDSLGDPLPAGAVARLGTLRMQHRGLALNGAAFSPDGKTITSTANSRSPLRFWDAITGKPSQC